MKIFFFLYFRDLELNFFSVIFRKEIIFREKVIRDNLKFVHNDLFIMWFKVDFIEDKPKVFFNDKIIILLNLVLEAFI
jgi:hypothetical protein